MAPGELSTVAAQAERDRIEALEGMVTADPEDDDMWKPDGRNQEVC
jgi:hypothetical protein